MKKLFVLTFVFLIAASHVFSVPIEGLITPAQRRTLEQASVVDTHLMRNPVPQWMPLNNELSQHVTGAINTLNPNIMVEALYLYKKPAFYHSSVYNWNQEQKTGIFNQMCAISTLTGIEYYSISRNSMRIFYENSRIIDGPRTRNPQPDPVFRQIPDELTLYARQKDLTFGDNVYRYDYLNTRDAVFFIQENVTTLFYGIIPVIGSGNLRSIVSVIDCGDSILVYAVSMTRAALLGFGDRISSSMSNRADAIINWFSDRLENHIFIR